MQTAYEIRVSKTCGDVQRGRHLVWSTGKISSDQSMYNIYAGENLTAGQQYFWQVKVWDNMGQNSGWSEPASWQMGMLSPSDWQAKWITPRFYRGQHQSPEPGLQEGIFD